MEQDQHRKVLKFLRMQKEHRENRGNPEQMLQKLSFLSAECCKLPWNIQEVFAAEFQVFYWRGLVFQKHTESRLNLLLKNWVLYGPLYRCKPCKASPWPVLPSLILELCLGVTLRDEHWISHNTASQDNVFKMLWGSSQQCWGLIFFFKLYFPVFWSHTDLLWKGSLPPGAHSQDGSYGPRKQKWARSIPAPLGGTLYMGSSANWQTPIVRILLTTLW